MQILGFAGSNSSNSINKKLVEYTLSLFEKCDIKLLDLNDYEVSIYSSQSEKKEGIPNKIFDFANQMSKSMLIVISLAEYNSSYTSAFKNIYDWISRIPNRKTFDNTPILLLATSTGTRGGANVLAAALDRFPRDGAVIWDSFSLPSFNDNFDLSKNVISNIELRLELIRKVNKIKQEKLELFDKNGNACGINRSKNETGDESAY